MANADRSRGKQSSQSSFFRSPGMLQDGELQLVLVRCVPADPLRGWVPSYWFNMQVGQQRAGGVSLRVGNTPEILLYVGHIGYSVEPEFRGRHFAERASRLLLPLAAKHSLSPLWITCNPDNPASRRTCERLGARLVDIVALPPTSDLYQQGEREKCRYRLDLTGLLV